MKKLLVLFSAACIIALSSCGKGKTCNCKATAVIGGEKKVENQEVPRPDGKKCKDLNKEQTILGTTTTVKCK